MIMAELQKLLQETMGLDAASIGSANIERAVRQRQQACGVKALDAYLSHVRECAGELQELIEAVVVPETWFFRDSEAFAALGKLALEEWLPSHPTGAFKVLSAPCSTGEEPYSMAMSLVDTGLPVSRFKIDGLDISGRSIALARLAVYGRNSFRGKNLEFRDRHFDRVPHGYLLAEAVRKQVHFQRANLLEADFQSNHSSYDIIFCRNLLIYLDGPTQSRVIKVLADLLDPKGIFFVGPAETALMINHDFVSAKLPLAFAFRKASAVPRHQAQPTASRQQPALPKSLPPIIPPVKLAAKPAPRVAEQPVNQTKSKSPEDLDLAERLANEGRLLEAAEICESYLREHKHSAKAFYLLGLVRDTAGDHEEAGEYYRKAIYLDANHSEALMHLAYLAEEKGDKAGATVLRNRARRSTKKGAK